MSSKHELYVLQNINSDVEVNDTGASYIITQE